MSIISRIVIRTDSNAEKGKVCLEQFASITGLICEIIISSEQAEGRDNAGKSLFVYYGNSPEKTEDCSLFIPYNKEDTVYKIQPESDYFSVSDNKVTFHFDVISYLFSALSYEGESGTTSLGNYLFEDFFKKHNKSFNKPYLNWVLKELKQALLQCLNDNDNLVFRNSLPFNKTSAIVLSHDIDYFHKSPINRLKMFRNVFKVWTSDSRLKADNVELFKFCLNRSDISLNYMHEIESGLGVKSVSNFSGYEKREGHTSKDAIVNPSYNFDLINAKEFVGKFEFGIHGSTRAFNNFETYQAEYSRINKTESVRGGRQHMLSFQFPDSFDIFDKIGLEYDMSMGFNDFNGYRNSSAVLHNPLHPQKMTPYALYEIPLVFMDSVFTKRGTIRKERILKDAEEYFKNIENTPYYTGSLCWHDSAFYKDSELAHAYGMIIQMLQAKGVHFAVGSELASFGRSCNELRLTENNGSLKLNVGKAVAGGLWIHKEGKNKQHASQELSGDFVGTVEL